MPKNALTAIAKKHDVTMSRTGNVTAGIGDDIRVKGLKLHGTNANIDAALTEMQTLMSASLEQIAARRALRNTPKTHRFPRNDDTKTWDAINHFGER